MSSKKNIIDLGIYAAADSGTDAGRHSVTSIMFLFIQIKAILFRNFIYYF